MESTVVIAVRHCRNNISALTNMIYLAIITAGLASVTCIRADWNKGNEWIWGTVTRGYIR